MRWVTLALLVLTAASPLAANDYFPMCPGSVWEYTGLETAGPYVTTCTGAEDFWGVECSVFAHSGTGDEGLLNYFFVGEGGGIFLRGAFRQLDDWGFIYEPGIEMLSANPALGQQWCDTVDLYSLPGHTYSTTFEICFSVLEEADLNLPGGTLHACGVGQVMPPMLIPGYDLFGRERSSSLSDASMWYADQVGLVQFLSLDMYQIAGYSLPPSATEVASWGRIKALYR
ncbi:hypothetical protein ACFL2Z_01585 [Candidatus Eisenbacteria bacterium]|uniref:Uncharacterized protein n=1 Tax=Eiseniibacteriota bacterium TaxID=2212470 RepID=A0ABV6YNU2_UNCEI